MARDRRSRQLLATGLLVAVAGLFVLARLLPGESYWLSLFRAGTEAALIGGLADWFAVVALFRPPLGLPIPHTAVIPNNKDRIADSLGQFVETNFLDPDLIGDRLQRAEPSRRLAAWLADPAKAAWLAERLCQMLPLFLGALRDRELRHFAGQALQQQLAEIDAAKLLGRGLGLLRASDQHQHLFDEILRQARRYLEDNRDTVLGLVEGKSAWWVPRQVDRRLAVALTQGVIELLGDLGQRDHRVRKQFDRALLELIGKLEADPETRALIERTKTEWLGRPEVKGYAAQILDGLQRGLERDLTRPHSQIRNGLTQALISLGSHLARDESMRQRLDERLVAGARAVVLPWRHQIGDFIAEVVKGWDSETVVTRLEGSVGRDLQYIRINGTLVGALVGCLLFVLAHAVF